MRTTLFKLINVVGLVVGIFMTINGDWCNDPAKVVNDGLNRDLGLSLACIRRSKGDGKCAPPAPPFGPCKFDF